MPLGPRSIPIGRSRQAGRDSPRARRAVISILRVFPVMIWLQHNHNAEGPYGAIQEIAPLEREAKRIASERNTEMKYLILVAATTAVFSNFALAREPVVGSDSVGQASRNASATSDQQRTGTFKIAMGPTSAAQKPGSSAEPMTSSPPPKKAKHWRKKSRRK
jgi:hypothetical protein